MPITAPWPVTNDSVAVFASTTLIGELRLLCLAAFDTTYMEDEAQYPALALPFPKLLVLAVQRRGVEGGIEGAESLQNETTTWTLLPLAPESPPDFWVVTGTAGRLPRDIPITATWSTLTRAYGGAYAISETGEFTTTFCRTIPTLSFVLDVSDDVLMDLNQRWIDARTQMPAGVTIYSVLVYPNASPPLWCSDGYTHERYNERGTEEDGTEGGTEDGATNVE